MSRILDSMSQSTVVSYPQVIQQLSPENSEKAKDSQVSVILSQGLKQTLGCEPPDSVSSQELPGVNGRAERL